MIDFDYLKEYSRRKEKETKDRQIFGPEVSPDDFDFSSIDRLYEERPRRLGKLIKLLYIV